MSFQRGQFGSETGFTHRAFGNGGQFGGGIAVPPDIVLDEIPFRRRGGSANDFALTIGGDVPFINLSGANADIVLSGAGEIPFLNSAGAGADIALV